MNSMKNIENGCIICGSDVRGNKSEGYYCKRCNVLFSYKNLIDAGKILPFDPMYVGSDESDKFHNFECRFAKNIKKTNRIFFKNPGHARANGYSPCKVCLNQHSSTALNL